MGETGDPGEANTKFVTDNLEDIFKSDAKLVKLGREQDDVLW